MRNIQDYESFVNENSSKKLDLKTSRIAVLGWLDDNGPDRRESDDVDYWRNQISSAVSALEKGGVHVHANLDYTKLAQDWIDGKY